VYVPPGGENAAVQITLFDGGSKMAEEPVQRKHWSDLLPLQITPEQWDTVQKEFAEALQAKERVEGIVYMCSLDMHLELLLRTVMIDDKSVDALMSDGQALQSFSSKLRLAYALGLIPEAVREDLYFLNKIRNAFAHKADVTSFDKAPVCDLCGNLSTAKGRDGVARSPVSAYRLAVVDNALFLASEIGRRAKEKASLQGQLVDSVESRYAAYRDRWYKPAK
jgi:DNA-binding MltR family transcriptional regulator